MSSLKARLRRVEQHQATEVYTYYSCVESETNPRTNGTEFVPQDQENEPDKTQSEKRPLCTMSRAAALEA